MNYYLVYLLVIRLFVVPAALYVPPLTCPAQPAERILFIGNSLTLSHPAPHLGWVNFWGMAATKPDKDYVHQMQLKYAACQGFVPEIGIIRGDLHGWDKVTGQLEFGGVSALEFNPDLVVVQMGEHATIETPYAAYLAAYSEIKSWTPNAHHIAVGIWGGPLDDIRGQHIERVAAETGMIYVRIRDLHTAETEARQYEDRGVAWHPNDLGHDLISDRIIDAAPRRVFFPYIASPSKSGTVPGTIP